VNKDIYIILSPVKTNILFTLREQQDKIYVCKKHLTIIIWKKGDKNADF